MIRFASVILDADSTLASIEGIDWLGGLRGGDVAARVAALTDEAMAGRVPLEQVYGRRLEIIAPTAAELEALAVAYREAVARGAAAAVSRLREAGVALRVVSGGLRPALLPLTRALGFADADVHAVDVEMASDGAFRRLLPTPLVTQAGKPALVPALALPRPVLAVGDGMTDLAMKPEVDAFAAFVGFVRRPAVVAGADHVLDSFAALATLVLGQEVG